MADDIVGIIRKCDSWSTVEDDGGKFGRYGVHVRFDSKDDARAFAVELMMVTSGQEPYGEIGENAAPLTNGDR